MKRFSASHAARIISGQLCGPDMEFPYCVRVDSRDVEPGCCFVAMKGQQTDGHMYIDEAVRRGASLVIASDVSYVRPDTAFIICSECEEAAVSLAKNWCAAISPVVMGITGSVGKTTTRELILQAISCAKRSHGAIKSYNTKVGCAMSILAMAPDTEYLVLEYGTNKPGDIRELVADFPPQDIYFTEITPAHLQGFGTVEGVLEAKLEMLGSSAVSHVTYNSDNTLLRQEASRRFAGYDTTSVGRFGTPDVLICDETVRWSCDTGPAMDFSVMLDGERVNLSVPVWGTHLAHSFAFAVSAAHRCGADYHEAARTFSRHKLLHGRGEVIRVRSDKWVIDETYNASPASVRAALGGLKRISELSGLKPYAVLGGMKELGDRSSELHSDILNDCDSFEDTVFVGREWEHIRKKLPGRWYMTTDEAASDSILSRPGLLLIKGSRGYAMEKLLEAAQ